MDWRRKIVKEDIMESILEGEIIEDYPDSFPFSSCLLYGMISKEKVIHVVLGYDGEHLYVVTVYIPDDRKFEKNLKVRRSV